MIEDPNQYIVWNVMGLVLLLILLAFIILMVQQSQKRMTVEADKRNRDAIRVQEEERLRIAANIHDDLVSQIHGVRLSYQKEEKKEELDKRLLHLLSSARSISHQLSPPMPDTIQLQELIGDYIALQSGNLSFFYRPDIRIGYLLNVEIKIQLFRIVQELITNVYKHALAQRMELLLRISPAYLCLLAKDNGIGLDKKKKTGLGLQNIEQRSKLLKARYKFKSIEGTTFILVLPLISNYQNES